MRRSILAILSLHYLLMSSRQNVAAVRGWCLKMAKVSYLAPPGRMSYDMNWKQRRYRQPLMERQSKVLQHQMAPIDLSFNPYRPVQRLCPSLSALLLLPPQ